jgi:hypothetical protein
MNGPVSTLPPFIKIILPFFCRAFLSPESAFLRLRLHEQKIISAGFDHFQAEKPPCHCCFSCGRMK